MKSQHQQALAAQVVTTGSASKVLVALPGLQLAQGTCTSQHGTIQCLTTKGDPEECTAVISVHHVGMAWHTRACKLHMNMEKTPQHAPRGSPEGLARLTGRASGSAGASRFCSAMRCSRELRSASLVVPHLCRTWIALAAAVCPARPPQALHTWTEFLPRDTEQRSSTGCRGDAGIGYSCASRLMRTSLRTASLVRRQTYKAWMVVTSCLMSCNLVSGRSDRQLIPRGRNYSGASPRRFLGRRGSLAHLSLVLGRRAPLPNGDARYYGKCSRSVFSERVVQFGFGAVWAEAYTPWT